jgi:hypothetical protein
MNVLKSFLCPAGKLAFMAGYRKKNSNIAQL